MQCGIIVQNTQGGKCKYSSGTHAVKVIRLESSCGGVTVSGYQGRTVQSRHVATEVVRRGGSAGEVEEYVQKVGLPTCALRMMRRSATEHETG